MANLILLIGKSGAGKSSSLRRLDPKTTFLFKALNKPLPFPEKKLGWNERIKFNAESGVYELINENGNYAVIRDTNTILQYFEPVVDRGFKNIIVDDATYTMIGEFMDRANEKSYDKFVDLAKNIWELNNMCSRLPNDVNVYLIWHIEENDFGSIKLRTVGKLTDEKIDIPALVTVTILAENKKGKREFIVNGKELAKSPYGMFEDDKLPNDLALIDEKIREYYGEEPIEYLDEDPFK